MKLGFKISFAFLSPFIALLIVSVLSGCAATSKASPEKSQAAKSFEGVAGKGVVYLYRPGRFVNGAGSTQIKVNGQNAGGTGPGTFFRWELNPGTYVFSASTAESSAAVELDVKEGKQYFIAQNEHLGLSAGRVSMKEVNEATGMKAVKGFKLLVSSYVPE